MEIEKYKNILRETLSGKTYCIRTYGCQMNVNDTMKIQAVLNDCGLSITDNINTSDISIMNTCCVRENAENKVLGLIGSLKSDKENNKDKIIIVLGCMTQQDGYAENLMKKYKQVDIVLGSSDADKMPEAIYTHLNKHSSISLVSDPTKPINEDLISIRDNRISEFTTIMTGCNNFCTYCAVPYVRGRERSREVDAILNEINSMVNNGTKEIVLLGQNVNSYGIGLDDSIDFSDLLTEICKSTDALRIRFMTSHPKDLSDKLINIIAREDKVCNHIHLPMQSGSNTMLKAMNRGYTSERYYQLIKKLRNTIPNIEISTDIIVGFPNESEQDFNDTLELVKQSQFSSAFMFKYSKRVSTPASTMENQVEEEIKSIRLQKLMNIQDTISEKIYQSYIGKELEILVENNSAKNELNYVGKSDAHITVNIEGSMNIGDIVNVEVIDAKKHTLLARKI